MANHGQGGNGRIGTGRAPQQQPKVVGSFWGGATRVSETVATPAPIGRDVPGAPASHPGGHPARINGGAK